MEENTRAPKGFFDKEKLLVDNEIINPFQGDTYTPDIHTHPFHTETSKGYIRYIIEGKSLIILDCVVVK